MYINTRRRLMDAVRKKRPQKWRINGWFLLLDNAPGNRSVMVKNVLPKNNTRMTTLEHPQYAPDLGPADFYMFTRLRSA
jgi:hypothetical protein